MGHRGLNIIIILRIINVKYLIFQLKETQLIKQLNSNR